MSPPRARAWYLIAGVFLVWSIAFVLHTSFVALDGRRYFCLFDDAMISMRYAWNLTHGLGLVWNAGEHVEGYSNLLMTLVMAAATALTDERKAVLIVQLLGIPTMLAIAALSTAIAREPAIAASGDHRLPRLAAIVALAYYPLAFWSLMGMETGLLCALMLGEVLLVLRWERTSQPPMLMGFAILGGFAAITRVDSLVVTGVLFAYVFTARTLTERPAPFRMIAVAVACTLLFPAAHELFRIVYYGDAVPNTYRLKLTGLPLGDRFANGSRFVLPLLGSIAPGCAIAAIALGRPRARAAGLFLAILVTLIGYQVWIGGDPWNYWRLVAPAMPLLLILVARELLQLGSAGGRFGAAWSRVGAPVALACVLLGLNWQFLDEIRFARRVYQYDANKGNVNAALALLRLTSPQATVGVFWAGTIPYYTHRRSVDFLGKSDKTIASRNADRSGAVAWFGMESVPGHNKYDLEDSIRRRRPTYVQGVAWGTQNLGRWADSAYVQVDYGPTRLRLLRGSPDVHWSALAAYRDESRRDQRPMP